MKQEKLDQIVQFCQRMFDGNQNIRGLVISTIPDRKPVMDILKKAFKPIKEEAKNTLDLYTGNTIEFRTAYLALYDKKETMSFVVICDQTPEAIVFKAKNMLEHVQPFEAMYLLDLRERASAI